MAKRASLIVKFGALIFIVFVPFGNTPFSSNCWAEFWIIQTMPAVLIGLYTRWFNAWALLIGWAAGTFAGTYMVASVKFRVDLLPDDRRVDLSRLHRALRADPQSGYCHRGDAANEYARRETHDQTAAADYYA